MKRIILILLLIAACTPKYIARQVIPPYGVGICHSVPATKPHDAIGWAYSTTPDVHWAELEPEKDQFDFSLLDAFVDARLNSGMQVWLSIQTVGVGINGERKAPMWLFEEGAVWIDGTCANDGMVPPWDGVYRERLPILLEAVNAHIAGWDAEHRNVIAGIIAMSGGPYGEMQVSSCGAKEAMKARYGLSDAQFNVLYGDAVRGLADIYSLAFPGMNTMWQVGYVTTNADVAVEQAVVDYLTPLFGDRLFIKWAGLDPVGGLDWQRRANEHYQAMFRELGNNGVRVGFEPAQPNRYKTDGVWDTAKFEEVFAIAEDSGASFMCFQQAMLPGLFDVPGWLAFDAALEANAWGVETVEHKGGVTWPGAPTGLIDGLAELGVNAVHHWNYSEAKLALAEEKGIEYLPHIWGCGLTDKPWDVVDLVAISQFAEDHPGLRWLVFNEPDRIEQANCHPKIAAEVYHDIYYALKEADPTALVYCCGTSRYEGHEQWLGAFMQEYSDKYLVANGGIPPMDGVHLHFYGEYERRHGFMGMQNTIMRTRNLVWTGIGGSEAWGELPWIISEWGVLSDVGDSVYEVEKTAAYMRNMWYWLEGKDWIETHFWYSTNAWENSGNLFVGRGNSDLTIVGDAWADLAHGVLPTPTPTSPPSPLPTPTGTPVLTPTSTFTPTPTATYEPTNTSTPTNTPTRVPTPTNTRTPTSTSTPTPSVLRLICEIDLSTGDVRCWPN